MQIDANADPDPVDHFDADSILDPDPDFYLKPIRIRIFI
jgi:hypothetical protein